jgi:nitrilase
MAPPKETKFKVAAAHSAPVYMNKAATIKKTVQLIEQAAAEDIKLLVFPETFIPGYPVGYPRPCKICSNTCLK